ncbi:MULTISPECIES: 3'-5' exonuclease [unclassified Bradyrhizobium]|uniref:3'-5' exonuclease n=1 Tax=unclassified Bradyrhizobium TaxID=2631580 RepID=UPI0028E99A39|nr:MULTISPECIES: 3'-5' exonuclease [unclassified Bradyrhizobium]
MLELALTFNRSLDRLPAAEQAAAKQVAFDYLADATRPGLSLHRIDRARDKRFWTVRVNRDLRIVVFKDGGRSIFCYVGHHDDAYAWAERRKFEVHATTGAAQIVEIAEIVREEIRVVTREVPRPGILANEDPAYLLSLGVPASYLDLLRGVDDDGFLDLLPRLPEEAREALWALATGQRPAARPADLSIADPFSHPDAQRRFWVATDEEALAQALEKPWAEWLVFLHPSQRAAVVRNFNGPARVCGAAGTGKSVVAMHRAANLAHQSQGGRILLTTFSKVLASRLSEGMDTLLGPASSARARVDVAHLHAYAHGHASRFGKLTIADDRTIDQLIAESRGNLDAAFDDPFLRAEWDTVIDFWGISSFEGYRDIPRIGRGMALSSRIRRRLWDVFAGVIGGLAARNLHTFGQVCDRLRERIDAAGTRPFQHVVVDEAQDLGPRELRLIAALATLGPRALFFAGDVGQRIFRWPFSWFAAGVDVRGRAQRLKVNYRTSAEIHRFSNGLLPAHVTEVDDVAEERETLSLLRGPDPEIRSAADLSGEIEILATWLAAARERGIAPAEIAIFARTRKALEERARPALARVGLNCAWLSVDQEIEGGTVTLATLHSAKGLEFRAVAVVSCNDAQLPLHQALDAAKEPEAKRLIEERELSLLYVGCTRARDQLLVSWSDEPSRFIRHVTK